MQAGTVADRQITLRQISLRQISLRQTKPRHAHIKDAITLHFSPPFLDSSLLNALIATANNRNKMLCQFQEGNFRGIEVLKILKSRGKLVK